MRPTRHSKSIGSDRPVGRHLDLLGEDLIGASSLSEHQASWLVDLGRKLNIAVGEKNTVPWRFTRPENEEKKMNLFAVTLVGAGRVIDRQWRVATDPEDVWVRLGTEGVQPEQIVEVAFVATLSDDNFSIYES